MNYIRDHVPFPLPEDYFDQRLADGWRLRAIEWERQEGASATETARPGEPVPYGLEVVSGSLQLEEKPREIAVLLMILEMIVEDRSVPSIAQELNQRGFRNREEEAWTASAVFELLPRVIEMGPTLLKSSAWIMRRPKVQTTT